MNLTYLYRKAAESGEIKSKELVLSKEELEKITEGLAKSIKEYREEFLGGESSNENNSCR
jgi:hypothetical protein